MIVDQLFTPKPLKEGGPYDLPGKDYDRPGDTPRKAPASDEHNPYPFSPEEDDDYFREIFRKKREAAKQQGMSEGDMDDDEPWHGIHDPELLQDLIADAKSMDYDDFHDTHSNLLNDTHEFWDHYHGGVAEGDNLSTFEEAECNHTMEGEYCPEHGLEECGNYGTYEGADDSTMSTLGKLAGAVTPNPKDFVQGFKKTFEDNEIVKNSKKLNDGWKGTLAGSAAGGIAGDMAGQALGPAAGAAIGGAVGGVPGAIAGGAMGALAGGPVGGAIGGLAGGKIGDKLGGKDEETNEDDSEIEEMKTGEIVKAATKAATQGLGDLVSGSGKEIAKNMLALESNSDSALLARIKSLALLK